MEKKCKQCGFEPTGNGETLNWDHVYCLSCSEIVHFNIAYPGGHVAQCGCGTTCEEFNTGKSVWRKGERLIHVFEADPSVTRDAVKETNCDL